jgi:ribulose-5-phosphate 4-epimerase/fuculose-1-phosphate aldolase
LLLAVEFSLARVWLTPSVISARAIRKKAERYLLSSSRSPELVTEDDIMEFDLDSNPIDQRGRGIFAERSIHGSVYKARPDVNAVCHNHAQQLIPFAATAMPIKVVWVMGAAIGDEVPIWDIRDDFPTDDGMLITTIRSDRQWQGGWGLAVRAYWRAMARLSLRRVSAGQSQ